MSNRERIQHWVVEKLPVSVQLLAKDNTVENYIQALPQLDTLERYNKEHQGTWRKVVRRIWSNYYSAGQPEQTRIAQKRSQDLSARNLSILMEMLWHFEFHEEPESGNDQNRIAVYGSLLSQITQLISTDESKANTFEEHIGGTLSIPEHFRYPITLYARKQHAARVFASSEPDTISWKLVEKLEQEGKTPGLRFLVMGPHFEGIVELIQLYYLKDTTILSENSPFISQPKVLRNDKDETGETETTDKQDLLVVVEDPAQIKKEDLLQFVNSSETNYIIALKTTPKIVRQLEYLFEQGFNGIILFSIVDPKKELSGQLVQVSTKKIFHDQFGVEIAYYVNANSNRENTKKTKKKKH